MLEVNKTGTSGTLYSSYGCDNGVALRVTHDPLFGYEIALVNDMFYTEQRTIMSRLIEKCKRIWCILRNKEYRYFNILIDERDMDDFKEFIKSL